LLKSRQTLAVVLVVLASLITSIYEFRVWSHGDIVNQIYGQHLLLLNAQAGNPVQYRVLPEYLWDWLIRFQTWRGSGDPIYTSAEVLRYSQNLLLFLLAFAYYRKLGLNVQTALVAMSVLTLMLTGAVFPNWMRLSSNFDASFYLLAGWLILSRKDWWILPLSALAAVNREASGFIPFMLLTARWGEIRFGIQRQRTLTIVGLSVVVWIALYEALRIVYGPQFLVTDVWLAAIQLNLLRETSWMNLFSTWGIVPIAALVGWRWWPPLLRTWFVLMVPLWITVHVLFSLINESLLFTEPVSLILLPAAFFSVIRSSVPTAEPTASSSPAPASAARLAPLREYSATPADPART
jgi:hypothetical protein